MSQTPWWYSQAACKGIPAGEVTRDICFDGCPVRDNCLAYALCVGDWFNNFYMPALVWGGYSGYEREKAMKATGYKSTAAHKLLTENE
jgi:hypothetical protein